MTETIKNVTDYLFTYEETSFPVGTQWIIKNDKKYTYIPAVSPDFEKKWIQGWISEKQYTTNSYES